MTKVNKNNRIEELIKKVSSEKKGELDLSSDEDLSIAIMNLLSIEEHFFFTANKTGNSDYYDLLTQVREMRKELLKKLIKEYEGEVWCISKHLLAASMRLMEVGTKQLGQANKIEAERMFEMAYDLYSLFWGINLKLIKIDGVKKIADGELNNQDKNNKQKERDENNEINEKTNIQLNNKNEEDKKKGFGSFREIVKKLVDCCKE